jgi:hypothetical protein
MNNVEEFNSKTIEDKNIEETMVVNNANLQEVNLENNIIIQTSPYMSSNPPLNAMKNFSISIYLGTSPNSHFREMETFIIDFFKEDAIFKDFDVDNIHR